MTDEELVVAYRAVKIESFSQYRGILKLLQEELFDKDYVLGQCSESISGIHANLRLIRCLMEIQIMGSLEDVTPSSPPACGVE